MKSMSTWDTYVKEAEAKEGERARIKVPISEDEYLIAEYPTRAQGRQIVESQLRGDTDGVLIGLLGEEAGTRIKDLAEHHPAFVLDAYILDVMRKFGMIPDEPDDDSTPPSATNGRATNGQAARGKAGTSRKVTSSSAARRKQPSTRSAAASK